MSEDGSVTDTYTYDAFGNLLKSTGRTENNYRYCGEQFDSTTGLYYLRARYMDTNTGRFITQDSYAGSIYDPVSLHKYLYANSNPVTYSDPSGYMSLLGEITVTTCIDILVGGFISGSVSMGMSILNALTAAKHAQQKFKFGSEQIMAFIEGFLIGSLFTCVGMLAASLQLGILYLALGVTGIIGFCGALKTGVDYWQNKDYGMAILYFGFAGVSLWGAKSNFDAAGAIAGRVNATNCGSACFTADTKVSTENGTKPIKDIEIGDKVWSCDIETGETELKSVTNIYIHEVDEILHLYTDEWTIDTTTNHPFYVEDKGWVAAGDLEIGDILYSVDGDTVEVADIEIEKLAEPIIVYNIEVDDFHTYFVGDVPVLVHNRCNISDNISRKNDDELLPPSKRGNAPVSKEDGKPLEIHHDNQNPNGPFIEMTFTEHRGKGNYVTNHPDYTKPSQIDRKQFEIDRKNYWNSEWDSGRWK